MDIGRLIHVEWRISDVRGFSSLMDIGRLIPS